ncbi:MAG: TauD/TfdA family dioxygenase [Alphaproteobacteria bacterium]|nr:TauD/TfdA family dioxygenase [Alphaproteobacteria bacterium]MBV9153718.1 TauD/TfdA family dioxygenase [Alphaproteobacteria bacterium]
MRISGIDLSQPLASEAQDAIWQAFLAHHVVVFPKQFLTREQQFAFAARFGEVEVHGAHRGEAKRYDVAHVMTNLDSDGRPVIRVSKAANYHWHTDKPYHAAPPALTMLRAVEVPPEEAGAGGDTEFANTALAYDALADETKRRIAALRIVFRPAFDDSRPSVDHPLVRTHPDVGRKALYLGNHSTHILGVPETQGRALLDELLAHATQPQFVYRHRWHVGDLVMWDNRCLLHRLVVDGAMTRYRRVMYRSVVKGTVPF